MPVVTEARTRSMKNLLESWNRDSVNRSSLPSTSKTMEEADEDDAIGREVCQICFESTSAMSPFFRVEGALHHKPLNLICQH